jgi:hypothetical protein
MRSQLNSNNITTLNKFKVNLSELTDNRLVLNHSISALTINKSIQTI